MSKLKKYLVVREDELTELSISESDSYASAGDEAINKAEIDGEVYYLLEIRAVTVHSKVTLEYPK